MYSGRNPVSTPGQQDAQNSIRFMRKSLESGGVLVPLRVETLIHAATIACLAGFPEVRARLAASLQRWGPAPGPRLRSMKQELEGALQVAEERLDTEELAVAAREGGLMNMGEALQYFLDATGHTKVA